MPCVVAEQIEEMEGTMMAGKARGQSPAYTPESCNEAVILRAYCESKFTIGESTNRRLSVTGEEYSEFIDGGYATAESARLGAQKFFDEYAEGKSGTLYWRIVPEIAYGSRNNVYAFYMRLLISDKPTGKVQ